MRFWFTKKEGLLPVQAVFLGFIFDFTVRSFHRGVCRERGDFGFFRSGMFGADFDLFDFALSAFSAVKGFCSRVIFALDSYSTPKTTLPSGHLGGERDRVQ